VTRTLSAIGALAVLVCACERQAIRADPAAESGRLQVYTVNYPLLYFAERIGGDAVQGMLPAPPGVDPADWWPDPETVAAFQAADLILQNGAGYARWVTLASLPRAKLVDTSTGFRDRLIPQAEGMRHVHGPEGAHVHADVVSTTWLDPGLAALQARSVEEALSAARPGQRSAFEARLAALETDLRALDARLSRAAERIGQTPLLFSHPVYAYLERAYGLRGRSVHWEPDELPDEAEWRALEALLAEHPARAMIWEAEPRPETAARLAALGVASVVYSPCGGRPEQGDWLTAMHRNADVLGELAD